MLSYYKSIKAPINWLDQSLPDKPTSQQLSPQNMIVTFHIQTIIFTDTNGSAYEMAHIQVVSPVLFVGLELETVLNHK